MYVPCPENPRKLHPPPQSVSTEKQKRPHRYLQDLFVPSTGLEPVFKV